MTLGDDQQLTATETMRLLNEAVAERGREFKYSDRYDFGGCDYSAYPLLEREDDGETRVDTAAPLEPACIVGLVLFKAGWEMIHINELAGVISDLLTEGSLSATPVAGQMLAAAQTAQDKDLTWGEGLDRAIEIYENRRGEE